MTITIYHGPWQRHYPGLQEYHLFISDPPFNTSEVERNALMVRPEWDVSWDPYPYVMAASRGLVPGGWFITKTSDRLFGSLRDMISQDHSNTLNYVEWMKKIGILGNDACEEVAKNLQRKSAHMSDFEYKATVVWTKNSGPYLRDTTYLSRHELFTVAKRLDEAGNSVESPEWNFVSVKAMSNHFSCGPCGAGERLYWHLTDRYEEDSELRGTIVPCYDKKTCDLCAQGDKRRSHPCQTPLYVWDWFLERHARKSLRLFDAFAGVGSLAKACQLRGIEYTGCEISWEYAQVGQRWVDGVWGVPEPEPEIEQLGFFGKEDDSNAI